MNTLENEEPVMATDTIGIRYLNTKSMTLVISIDVAVLHGAICSKYHRFDRNKGSKIF